MLDDEARGVTPLTLGNVTVGSHSLRLEAEGFAPWRAEVMVEEGRTVQLRPSLEQKPEPTQAAAGGFAVAGALCGVLFVTGLRRRL